MFKLLGRPYLPRGGADWGTDLERGMGMCGLEDPFSHLSRSSQGFHFKQKSLKVISQDPFWKKIYKF